MSLPFTLKKNDFETETLFNGKITIYSVSQNKWHNFWTNPIQNSPNENPLNWTNAIKFCGIILEKDILFGRYNEEKERAEITVVNNQELKEILSFLEID